MKENYSLEECNTKGFKGSIDDYIACIKRVEGIEIIKLVTMTKLQGIVSRRDITPTEASSFFEKIILCYNLNITMTMLEVSNLMAIVNNELDFLEEYSIKESKRRYE